MAAEDAGKKVWPIVVDSNYIEIPFAQILDGVEPKQARRTRVRRSYDVGGISIAHSKVTLNTGDVEVKIDDRSTNIGRDAVNSQVGQTLVNCTNIVRQQLPGELRSLLELLSRDVQAIIAALPDDKQDEAPHVAENLEMLVKQATSEKPNRKWYSVAAEGLLDAAKWAKGFAGNLASTIGILGKTIWPDFELSSSK